MQTHCGKSSRSICSGFGNLLIVQVLCMYLGYLGLQLVIVATMWNKSAKGAGGYWLWLKSLGGVPSFWCSDFPQIQGIYPLTCTQKLHFTVLHITFFMVTYHDNIKTVRCWTAYITVLIIPYYQLLLFNYCKERIVKPNNNSCVTAYTSHIPGAGMKLSGSTVKPVI